MSLAYYQQERLCQTKDSIFSARVLWPFCQRLEQVDECFYWSSIRNSPRDYFSRQTMHYLTSTWLIYKVTAYHMHINTWTNKHLIILYDMLEKNSQCLDSRCPHYGNTSTSRVESAHAAVKKWMGGGPLVGRYTLLSLGFSRTSSACHVFDWVAISSQVISWQWILPSSWHVMRSLPA